MNHPVTEEKVGIVINGVKYESCPQFNVDGTCSDYDCLDPSGPCKNLDCEIMDNEDLDIREIQSMLGVRNS